MDWERALASVGVGVVFKRYELRDMQDQGPRAKVLASLTQYWSRAAWSGLGRWGNWRSMLV